MSAASAAAGAEVDRRLNDVLRALPGRPQMLGDAALDRCLRMAEFEGADPGPMHCQWQKARYVSFDGNLRETAQSWYSALDRQQWAGSPAPLPPDSGYTAERYEYIDAETQDYLIITMVRDSVSVPLLDNEQRREGFQETRREHQEFGSRKAAEQALTDGRRIAEITLIRTYYSESDRPRPPY
ncbi:hypothetical protein [Streptomyces sp. 8N616]|uniref:hypothetical protein n=1 Tax=Streptomyces sp. 8N616 TaxID=3457414 RepID=UPI003FD31232